MKNTQQEVVSVLLRRIFTLGLISQFTYSKAEDLVHSGMDFPELFRYPMGEAEEGCLYGCTQDS